MLGLHLRLISRRLMNGTLFLAVVVATTACVAVPVSHPNPVIGDYIAASNTTAPVCLVVPADASFNGETAEGSGRLVANHVAKYLRQINEPFREVSNPSGSLSDACLERGTELVLVPEILKYEDNVTGWSGNPDRIAIRLVLSDLSHPAKKRTVIYEAKSDVSASGFLEWGNAAPAQLLGDDFGNAIRRLFAHP